ncbi:MAG: hypothetical protein ABL921_34585 [Pirellula sp.]
MSETDKSCFFVSPIGGRGTDVRGRADRVLRHIVRPACEACGYIVIRADELDEPGMITRRVIKQLLDAAIVIADLSGNNPNVFYELGIRHATGRPVIQLCNEGERLPFDVFDVATIFFDHTDLDSASECRTRLESQIKSVISASSRTENPVTAVMGENGRLLGTTQKDVGVAEEFERFSHQVLNELKRLQEDRMIIRSLTTLRSSSNPSREQLFETLTGLWMTNVGPLLLTQEGSLLFGRYEHSPSRYGEGSEVDLQSENIDWTGEITGKIADDVVVFKWRWIDGSRNGIGFWRRQEDELSGGWFYDDELPDGNEVEDVFRHPNIITSLEIPADREWIAFRSLQDGNDA